MDWETRRRGVARGHNITKRATDSPQTPPGAGRYGVGPKDTATAVQTLRCFCIENKNANGPQAVAPTRK